MANRPLRNWRIGPNNLHIIGEKLAEAVDSVEISLKNIRLESI